MKKIKISTDTLNLFEMDGLEEYNKIKDMVGESSQSKNPTGPYSFSSLLNNSTTFTLPSSNENLYTDLMNKEERVIDTVDRVVNHAKLSSVQQRKFFHQPLNQLLLGVIRTMRLVFNDMVHINDQENKIKYIANAIMKEDRKMYIGVILISMALLASMVHFGL